MEKGLRNTFIGIIATLVITFVGAWIQINSRIAILETQVDNDHQLFMDKNSNAQEDMKQINEKLDEINIKVTHLNDIKEDRAFVRHTEGGQQ